MQCPKDKGESLSSIILSGNLAAHQCPVCEGTWVSADDYESWQASLSDRSIEPVPADLDLGYEPSPLDAKGGLCPDCGGYLARARIGLKHPFYVERCVKCGGVWCDRGEWPVLEHLGLHVAVEQLFTSDWQLRSREREYLDRERRATVEKLGDDLAQRVFDLADQLAKHPNGDFGVAYLMRRFEQ
ncbi:zf-TFIIB domain-containing protein [Leptolyngbya sp. AN02str]|uniref:zf-TFIIB domain-containing protein n=1 Tax=Leptolyngbya sp. AN02str TaxID=3423363 RepID=UPI003D31CF22